MLSNSYLQASIETLIVYLKQHPFYIVLALAFSVRFIWNLECKACSHHCLWWNIDSYDAKRVDAIWAWMMFELCSFSRAFLSNWRFWSTIYDWHNALLNAWLLLGISPKSLSSISKVTPPASTRRDKQELLHTTVGTETILPHFKFSSVGMPLASTVCELLSHSAYVYNVSTIVDTFYLYLLPHLNWLAFHLSWTYMTTIID